MLGWIDLGGLLPESQRVNAESVLNGMRTTRKATGCLLPASSGRQCLRSSLCLPASEVLLGYAAGNPHEAIDKCVCTAVGLGSYGSSHYRLPPRGAEALRG